jgi:hypothetical protein
MLQTLLTTINLGVLMKIFQSKEGRMKEPPRKTIEEAETYIIDCICKI